MSQSLNLAQYPFSEGEKILIDANIWLYLYPAPSSSSHPFIQQYSAAYRRLIESKAQPVLDPIILSEYINRYIRIEYNATETSGLLFKDFRQMERYIPIAEAVCECAKAIMRQCVITKTPANSLDIYKAINEITLQSKDFNDSLLIDICQQENLKFMTNDADFKDCSITVLTTNPRLLS